MSKSHTIKSINTAIYTRDEAGKDTCPKSHTNTSIKNTAIYPCNTVKITLHNPHKETNKNDNSHRGGGVCFIII